MRHSLIKERDLQIKNMRAEGYKMAMLGAMFYITRQRVSQILKKTKRTTLSTVDKKLDKPFVEV